MVNKITTPVTPLEEVAKINEIIDALSYTSLESAYPVGSIYIGTMATCPLASLFGTWTLVGSGRVLQGSDADHNAGTTIEAGLPNITGKFDMKYAGRGDVTASGAFSKASSSYKGSGGNDSVGNAAIGFNASNSNSIYGNSTTVQPPAYVVNIWERTA